MVLKRYQIEVQAAQGKSLAPAREEAEISEQRYQECSESLLTSGLKGSERLRLAESGPTAGGRASGRCIRG